MAHLNRHDSIVGRQFSYGRRASPLLVFVPDLMDNSDCDVATPHCVTYDVIIVEPYGQTRQLASLL